MSGESDPQEPREIPCMLDWALGVTPPNAEHLVAADLDRFGYSYQLFRRSVTRAHRGQVVELFRPAFPRYILVPFGQCWNVLRDIWRLAGLVTFGETVAKIRGAEIAQLIDRCDGGSVLPPDPVVLPFAHGERVHVGGTSLFAGHDGIFEDVVEQGRLRVSFVLMGRMTRVDVDERDVFVCKRRYHKRGRRGGHRKRFESAAPIA